MAEGARLESVYTFVAYRGFESLSLRQIQRTGFRLVFFAYRSALDDARIFFVYVKRNPLL